jgi:hypothetical protein
MPGGAGSAIIGVGRRSPRSDGRTIVTMLQPARRIAGHRRGLDPSNWPRQLGALEAERQEYHGPLSDAELLVFGKRCELAYQKRQPPPDIHEFLRSWRTPRPPHPIGTGHWPLVIAVRGGSPAPPPAEPTSAPQPPLPAPPRLDPIPLYPVRAVTPSPLRRILTGAAWRIAVTLLALCCAAAGVALPVLGVAGVAGVGVVTGLWYRGWGIARVWRWLIGAGLVAYVLPLLLAPMVGRAIALTLVLAVVAPILVAIRNLDG